MVGGYELLTCRDDVIHNQDLLTRLDGIRLHLEEVCAILLLIGRRDARAGELALLSDRGKADSESEGKSRTEEEATRIQADDNVGLGGETLLRL